MRLGLYQLFDTRAQVVTGPIIAARSPVIIMRSLAELLADKEAQPTKNPEDYVVLKLGEQDDQTGQIIVQTVDAAQFKNNTEELVIGHHVFVRLDDLVNTKQ